MLLNVLLWFDVLLYFGGGIVCFDWCGENGVLVLVFCCCEYLEMVIDLNEFVCYLLLLYLNWIGDGCFECDGCKVVVLCNCCDELLLIYGDGWFVWW